MKLGIVRGVALCATVAAAQICVGAAQSVTFDAALTNSMGWTFSGGIKRNSSGRYYIGAKDPLVISPGFKFAITSIVFSVELSASCTRNFIVAPADDATRSASLAREFHPVPTDTRIAVEWHSADEVTAFTISSTSGANNLYIDSAEILGVSLLPAPTALRATCGDGFAVVRWVNPPGVASNVVEVAKIVEKPEDGEVVVRYDFDEFRAGGNPVSITNELPEACAGLSGSFVYAPANSQGVIQLSNGDNRGVLVHNGFPSYAGKKLRLVSRKYGASDATRMNIAYIVGNETNDFAYIDNAVEFATNDIDLSSVPDGAKIVLNSSGAKTNHRVILDGVEFLVFSHEENLPSVVASGVRRAIVSPVELGAMYRASATAIGGDGTVSDRSETLEFTAERAAPLRVLVQ